MPYLNIKELINKIVQLRKVLEAPSKRVVLFLSGPPKAGKSKLFGELRFFLLQEYPQHSWILETASPDSTGSFVSHAYRHSVEAGVIAEQIARERKLWLKEMKHAFSPEWVAAEKQTLQRLSQAFSLVVADLGGLPSSQNEELVKGVLETGAKVYAVLLTGGDPQLVEEWRNFWRQFGEVTLIEGASLRAENIIRELEEREGVPEKRPFFSPQTYENSKYLIVDIRFKGILNEATDFPRIIDLVRQKLDEAQGRYEGVIISGRLPLSLTAAIAQDVYQTLLQRGIRVKWVAIFAPQHVVGDGLVPATIAISAPNSGFDFGELIKVHITTSDVITVDYYPLGMESAPAEPIKELQPEKVLLITLRLGVSKLEVTDFAPLKELIERVLTFADITTYDAVVISGAIPQALFVHLAYWLKETFPNIKWVGIFNPKIAPPEGKIAATISLGAPPRNIFIPKEKITEMVVDYP